MDAQVGPLPPHEADPELPAGKLPPEAFQAGATFLAARSAGACSAALKRPQQGRPGCWDPLGGLHGHEEGAAVSEPEAAGPGMEGVTVMCWY